MSEISMLERVSRAIANAYEPGYDWTCFVDEARAAIEAMRTPGDDFAGYLQLAHDLRPQDWSELIDAALNTHSEPQGSDTMRGME